MQYVISQQLWKLFSWLAWLWHRFVQPVSQNSSSAFTRDLTCEASPDINIARPHQQVMIICFPPSFHCATYAEHNKKHWATAVAASLKQMGLSGSTHEVWALPHLSSSSWGWEEPWWQRCTVDQIRVSGVSIYIFDLYHLVQFSCFAAVGHGQWTAGQ
jgi:hypothetical protein